GEVVATHRLGSAGAGPVWDPAHRAAAEAIALAPHRRREAAGTCAPPSGRQRGLDLGTGDYEVEPVDLARYDLARPEPGCGCLGTGA
ncbi:MAG: hypothetical protein ACRDX8_07175, partial [Acidimicrobiales bacterium]